MSDAREMVLATTDRLLRDHVSKALIDAAENGEFAAGLWQALQDNGLTLAPVPEAAGGAGLELADGMALLRTAGAHAAPVPLAEHMLAAHALADAGIALQPGLLGVAAGDHLSVVDGRMTGAVRVPWGRRVDALVCLCAAGPLLVRTAGAAHVAGASLAGEPVDLITLEGLDAQPVGDPAAGAALANRMALARALQMTGALERILELSVRYAGEREQFGRPIARFQAIQHQLALLAAEVAAAIRATDGALDALGGDREAVEIAVAKARVGEAVGRSTDIAHQVHGAIGFTHEHQLHQSTRRLWAWRDDWGDEVYWQKRLGAMITAAGADQAWAFMVGR